MVEKAEKVISINLRGKMQTAQRWKYAKIASLLLRGILKKQKFEGMKDDYKIKFDSELNEKMWNRGIRNPPTKLKIKLTKKDENLIDAKLAG